MSAEGMDDRPIGAVLDGVIRPVIAAPALDAPQVAALVEVSGEELFAGSRVRPQQFTLQQSVTEADWLIGADCLGPGVKGRALRSMAEPGAAYTDMLGQKDPQPAHMHDYVSTTADNGGVHVNSGIPNHAFFLIATTLGGNAWEKAGRIWYETIRDPRLRPTIGFQTFAATTVRVAVHLYGPSSSEVAAVRDGWQQVGIQA